MLIRDDSCISAESSINGQMQYRIPELMGCDWMGIADVHGEGNVRILADVTLSDDPDMLTESLLFLERNARIIAGEPWKSGRIFPHEKGEYLLFRVRSTANQGIVTLCYGKSRGRFDEKSIEWARIYYSVASERKVLFNQYVQETNYNRDILENVGDAILILDRSGKMVSASTSARNLMESHGITDIKSIRISKNSTLGSALEGVAKTGSKKRLNTVILPDSSGLCVLDIILTPFYDSKNRIVGVVVFCMDVTGRALFDHELTQLQQYALVGEISLGLSHDIKNPLMNILNCANILKRDLVEESDKELAQLITNEVYRIDGILGQMMSYQWMSNEHENRYTLLDLNTMIRNCAQIVIRQRFERDIKIEYMLDPAIPPFRARYMDLQQIFINILVNAMQAIPEQGIIQISSRLMPEGEFAAVDVVDDGVGLFNIAVEDLFKPYYTTKKNGTGLGLFTVRRTVERMGGTVELFSNDDGNTQCTVVLPLNRTDKDPD